ncbi:MAG TPA: hypothetical protein VH333_05430 [Pseudonocardiaceae bacterium]|nr:hypothetical protein [Pseudonocardiaceae bacterium]
MRFVRAFGRFWYEFIVGDDPKIAIAVVVALAVLVGALSVGLFGDTGLALLGGVLIVAAFAITLLIDTRPPKTKQLVSSSSADR